MFNGERIQERRKQMGRIIVVSKFLICGLLLKDMGIQFLLVIFNVRFLGQMEAHFLMWLEEKVHLSSKILQAMKLLRFSRSHKFYKQTHNVPQCKEITLPKVQVFNKKIIKHVFFFTNGNEHHLSWQQSKAHTTPICVDIH